MAKIGAFVLIVYTSLTAIIAIYSIRSANAAREAVRATQKQLEMTDRPWISLEGINIEPPGFIFTPQGEAHLTIHPVMKNIGHSVATDVTLKVAMVLPTPSDFVMIADREQKKLCKPFTDEAIGIGNTFAVSIGVSVIFPEHIEDSWGYGADLIKNDIAKGQVVVQISGTSKGIIAPLLIGCIDYRYSSSTRHHQTGFAYDIRRGRSESGQFVPKAIVVGSNVEANDIGLMKSFFSGFYAY